MEIKIKRVYRDGLKNSVSEYMGYYQLNRPSAVYDLFKSVLSLESGFDQDKEHFWILGCTAKNVVKVIELISLGALDNAPVHPREVLRPLIVNACASYLCCHNHPSGDPAPSHQDVATTQRLKEASQLMGIQLLDHIVIGADTYVSVFDHYPELRD